MPEQQKQFSTRNLDIILNNLTNIQDSSQIIVNVPSSLQGQHTQEQEQKIHPKLWNARTSNEVQRVENLNIDPDILSTFKIDLRKLWNQRPVRSFRRAHRRRKMRACMMLESTETIAIEDAFPSRAALLLRRSFHNIRYNLCVWRRS